tara:strand:+ start:103 stop:321 length:219 start_codon:yes stop_codon:yes gene_type:complete
MTTESGRSYIKSKHIKWKEAARLYALVLQNPNTDSDVKNDIFESIEFMGSMLDRAQKANPTWFEAEIKKESL